jgi:leucyl-tRNA synthetase
MKDFNEIAKKWQEVWDEKKVFKAEYDSKRPKFYCLEMFPYPSGHLHIGHLRNYSIGDCFARYKRMKGFNVLYPMGYDSFGLPAENAAIERGVEPEKWTLANIEVMEKQHKSVGLSYDWSREVITCKPDYYRWNQWIFLKFFEKGLAYRKSAPVNWCPKCKSVLANEQVHDGKCWRHTDTEVEQKMLDQWYFKIKDYAQELLDGHEQLEGWPENVKVMQKNWIGRSEGVDIHFKLDGKHNGKELLLPTYTTRCDTIYSVTFLVIAPEHPLVMELVEGTEYEKETVEVIEKIKKQTEIERTTPEGKDKLGCFLGKYAINPVNGEKVPIYVANFVMMYGSGIVMADAHDQRDFEFAKKYNIPLKFVISDDGDPIDPDKATRAFTSDGLLYDSGEFSGRHNRDALPDMADWIEKKGFGKKKVNYKLRDWLISRQRYWGTPIPIVYCPRCGVVPVPEKELPVLLPKDVKFTGKGNPLETSESYNNCKCPKCSATARRETDTMDTFVDSSWYFLRYCDPKNEELPFDEGVKDWMPVDQYIGGIEHACMHLIYARFYTKALRDIGLIDIDEPFKRLLTQGMVLQDGAKMSKSLGNTVDPKEINEKFGPDTARVFILFTALPEKELEWSDEGVKGAYKFLNRILELPNRKLFLEGEDMTDKDRYLISNMHKTIKKVSEFIEDFRLSLAIGALMEFVNDLLSYREDKLNRFVYFECVKNITIMLTPFAPHIAEEIWEILGEEGLVSVTGWPIFDETKIDEEAEAAEDNIHTLISDIRKVLDLAKIKKPEKINVIVSYGWKYRFVKLLKEQLEETRDVRKILNLMINEIELRKHGKDIAKLVPAFVKDPGRIPKKVLDQKKEFDSYNNIKDKIEKEFLCDVEVSIADDSDEKKANSAMPGKPAIVVE